MNTMRRKKHFSLGQLVVTKFHQAIVSRVGPVPPREMVEITIKIPQSLANKRTLKDIEIVAGRAFGEFFRSFINLCAIPGSVIITWFFPKCLTNRLKQLAWTNKAVFKQEGVEEVTIAGEVVFLGNSEEMAKLHQPQDPVLSDPHFTEYMTSLKQIYKDPPQPWGPLPECELIKLAVIKEEQCRGPDDSIAFNKSNEQKMAEISPVEMDKLFDDGTFDKDRKVILVEGAPGMGKTMLAHHYCQKWAAGELSMFDAVILVPLRELDADSDSSLANLLLIASAEHVIETTNEMAEHVASLLENVKILFIFDGWDEFPAACKDQKRSCVQRIINKPQSVSPQTTILITSRPDSSLDLHQLANRVEILGFTEDNVYEYFRKALQHKLSFDKVESGFSKLRNHLDDYPVIKSSCYVPLNAAILVYVFCEHGQALPKTRYELFHELILYHINRERGTRPHMRNVECVSSLEDPNVKDQLSHICKLAYEGVMQTKAVFEQKEISAYSLPTQFSTLGLLQRVEHFVHSCRTFSYHFLHLSIQELLAAHHISQMEEGEQVKVFESLLGEPQFSAILQFYAAITKLTNQGVQNIITGKEFLLENCRRQRCRLLLLLNCLFEAQLQDQSLYHRIISNLNSKLNLEYTTLSPVDCMSVGYFLVSILPMPTGELTVNLQMCRLTAHSMSLLLGEFSRHNDTSAGVLQGIVSLGIGYNNIGDSGIAQIARALSMNSTLRRLVICHCDITEVGVESLVQALATSSSLQELDVSNNKIGENALVYIATVLKRSLITLNIGGCGITVVGLKSLVETLTANSSLQELFLDRWKLKMGLKRIGTLPEVVIRGHHLSTEGVVSVAETLIANKPPQELTIWGVDIGDSGIAGIAIALRKCNTLKKLIIGECGITEVGVESLVETLIANSSLQQLFLDHWELKIGLERNGIMTEVLIEGHGFSTEGVVSVAETLIANNPLQDLTIRYVCIGDSGIAGIATALKKNNTLKELNIIKCGITEVGVEPLAEALTINSSLKMLIVSDNNIGDNGAVGIAKTLERNSTLEELDISGCCITEVGVESLADALATSSSLQQLCLECSQLKMGLERNGILTEVVIKGHCLSTEGVVSVALKLIDTNPLQELTIRGVDIGDSVIAGITTALEKNNTLKKLNIIKCGKTTVGVESLADALATSSSLQQLFLDHWTLNMVLERNGIMTEVLIEGHDLSTGGVVSTLIIIANNPLLELTINYKDIGDSVIAGIATALKSGNVLKKLSIECCGITEVGVELFAEALAFNSSLKKLIIGGNDIGDNGIVHIAKALERNSTLEELDISRCGLKEVGVESLSEALAVNSSLKKLIVSDSNIGDNGIVHIAKALERNSTLEELDISRCSRCDITVLGELDISRWSRCDITVLWVESLTEALAVNTSLKKLIVRNNIGAVGIAKALERNSTLEELDISGCGLEEVGVESLTEALAVNTSLKKLIVRNNIGAVGIAKALERNGTLEELDISGCGLEEVGVESLSEALAVNSSLKKLIVSDNNIGDNGIVHIAKALERNSVLEELNISGYAISEVGVESLAVALPMNHSLESLALGWSSRHPDQTLRKLAECVKRSALKEFHLAPLTNVYLNEEKAREFLQSVETGGKEFIQSQEDGDLRKIVVPLIGSNLWFYGGVSYEQQSQVCESLKASASLVNSARREKGRPPIDVESEYMYM